MGSPDIALAFERQASTHVPQALHDPQSILIVKRGDCQVLVRSLHMRQIRGVTGINNAIVSEKL